MCCRRWNDQGCLRITLEGAWSKIKQESTLEDATRWLKGEDMWQWGLYLPLNTPRPPVNPKLAEQKAPKRGENLPLEQGESEPQQCEALLLQFKNSMSISLGSAQLMTSTTGAAMGSLKGTQSAGRKKEGTVSRPTETKVEMVAGHQDRVGLGPRKPS